MNKKPRGKAKVAVVESAKSEELIKGVEVSLPSLGIPYEGLMSTGKITLRPPRVSETKYFGQMSSSVYEVYLTTILSQLMITPSAEEFDPWNLTDGDRSYLLLWIRNQIHTYYHIAVTCPKCSHIESNYQYPLDEVPISALTEDYKHPKEIPLNLDDGTEARVVVGLVFGTDEKEKDRLRKEKKFDKIPLDAAAVIRQIDGKEMSLEERYVWVDTVLKGGEEAVLGQWIKWTEHGPDYNNCKITCLKCGKGHVIRLPFRREFFNPTIPFERDFRDAVDCDPVREGKSVSGDAGAGADGDRGVPAGSSEGA